MTSRTPLLVALTVGLSIAIPCIARAAEPTKTDCLDASEAWLAQRKAGKLRAARGELLVCAAASCPKDVREECAQHVPEIGAAIPTLVFEVKDASGEDVSAVRVTLDGAPLVDWLDGTAIPLDPGDHLFTFVAEGLPPWRSGWRFAKARRGDWSASIWSRRLPALPRRPASPRPRRLTSQCGRRAAPSERSAW